MREMTEKKYYKSGSSSRDRSSDPYSRSRDNYNDRYNSSSSSNSYNRGGRSDSGYGGGRYGGNGGSSTGGYRSRTSAPAPPSDLPVVKNFYQQSPKTANRSQYEINEWLMKNNVTFRGPRVLNPILEFDELLRMPDGVMHSIMKQGFTTPTVIQSQAWPLALSGRDVVGIAQTGSGKTLGYSLPALVHVEGNAHRRKYGPSVLILAPTRELAQQIKDVVNMFRTRAVCVFGGASKPGQRRELERVQPSIIIACPGRLIDFVEEGAIQLHNISYLVLDEADRMLDMGFEPQIRRIIDWIPKDRQTLMWSATWPKEVRKLAEDFLTDYIQVNIGSVQLAANHNITQIIDICEEHEKVQKLYKLLTEIGANNRENKTIIFAETKRKVDQLSHQMRSAGWCVSAIHGDKPQSERDWVLNDFRSGRNTILIATDVAARGLDVDDIKYVVNFDYPSCSEDYVHRIGRTGRRDRKGTSYTFFTLNNAKQANDLIDVLKEANQEVPNRLYEIADQSHRYGKTVRRRYGGGYGGGRFGSGGGRFGNSNGYGYGGGGGSYDGKRKFDDYGDSSKRFRSGGTNYGGGANGISSFAAPPPPPPANGGSSTDRYNSYG